MSHHLSLRPWIATLTLALGIGLHLGACKPAQEVPPATEPARPEAKAMAASPAPAPADHDDIGHDHEEEHDHHHTAPHGGTLLVLGGHLGHIEVVLDPSSGRLTLYSLDGHAESPVRMKEPNLVLTVIPEGGTPFELQVAAQENALTGETSGDTSQFSVTDERLKNLQRFQGRIGPLSFRGTSINETEFNFPDGNE
ncbi:MAG: hypothetical protein JNK74_02225 [Candidatus Hydrogenedentes bacterium]|nr:hypothetical protein [Candidatus Hydrogenedentota bacterium]